MTTLFVANTTKQNHMFTVRRPEMNFPRGVPIPAGTQVAVIQDGDSELVDSVIAQHRRYGLVPVHEAAKAKRFVGLCYSIDKEIAFRDMKVVFEKNDKVLEQQGKENVEQVAKGVNAVIDEKLQEAGVPTAAAHVEVEVKEENTPGTDTTVAVGAEVVKPGQQPRRSGGRR